MTVQDEELINAVRNSTSVMGVLKLLGKRAAGGTHAHYSNRIKRLGVSTEHFKNGGQLIADNRRLSADDIFRKVPTNKRVPANQLRRALKDVGTLEICDECGQLPIHNGKPLRLEVDHINGEWSNNSQSNLRLLCPNCHTQTGTYGNQRIVG